MWSFAKTIPWESGAISRCARGQRDPITFGLKLLCFVGRYLKNMGNCEQSHRSWYQQSKV